MTREDRIQALRGLEQKLSGAVKEVSVRGLTTIPYLFAQNDGRSAEVEWGSGDWRVELWEIDENEYRESASELVTNSEVEALTSLVEWLTNNRGG